jgi:hypothetical protein
MSDLLNKASLVMIPSGYKEDVVYSAVPSDGSGDLAFSRASNGTRVNSAGLVEVCPWNLIQNSQTFASWSKVQISGNTVTVTDNFTTAPNGTLTAAKVVFGTFDTTGQIYQDYTLSPTQVLNTTLYAKVPSGTRQVYFGFFDGLIKTQLKTLTTEWQRIEYTGSIDAGAIRACWFYGVGAASNVEVHLWGGQLNVGSTAKPYFPTTDRLNVPRLTYQNGGGGCPSLLLEKQSTNYLNYSNDFTQAAWSASGSITRTANYAVSPDGTQTATRIQWNGSDGELYQYLGQASPTRSSVYVKGTAGQVINFCLNLITLTGEWQRIEAASLIDGSNTWFGIITKSSVGHTATDFLLWGGQGENGTYATSLIYTTSASATRVADACFKTGISSLIGQTEGVLFADVTLTTRQSFSYISISDGGSSANYIGMYFRAAAIELEVVNVGVLQGNVIYSNSSTGRFKVAIGYKENDFVLYINGTQIGIDTSGTLPTCNYLDLFGFGQEQPFEISQTVLFKTRLSNYELQSLTTL